MGSNQGPTGYEPGALTTELMAHIRHSLLIKNWSGWQDLNPRPTGPKPVALPNCATPRHNLCTQVTSLLKIVVGVAGFEPAAHWSQTSCATKLRYTPISLGRGRRTRTLGTWFWRPLLYQLSYTPISLGQILWRRRWDSNPCGPIRTLTV